MKFLIFIFISTISYAQNIVSGNVVSEYHTVLSNVVVVNIGTDKKVLTDNEGSFKIEANVNDELRFIKENYERGSKVVHNNDFLTPMSIQLVRVPIEIEEVNVITKPTGNLGRDSKNHNSSEKVLALNNEVKEYVKKPVIEIQPKNEIPSSFAPRNPYEGQLNLFSIDLLGGSLKGVTGLLINEGSEKNIRKPNFSEIQNFHKKVKEAFYGDYYIKRGLNEADFDAYIVYLDDKYKFSENYFSNFDSSKIEQILKILLKEFIK